MLRRLFPLMLLGLFACGEPYVEHPGRGPDFATRRDGLVVHDIDLYPKRGATRGFDLGDRAVGGHVLGLGLEFLI